MRRPLLIGSAVALAALIVLGGVATFLLGGVDYFLNFNPGSCDPGNARLQAIQADPVLHNAAPGTTASMPQVIPATTDLGGNCLGPKVLVNYSSTDLRATYDKLVITAKATGWVSPSEPYTTAGSTTPSSFYSKQERGWEAALAVGQIAGYQDVTVTVSAPPAIGKPH